VSFLRVDADCRARSLPTAVDPVKLILCSAGLVQSASPTAGVVSRLAVTTLTTPGS
jgi:hypothetical protein